MSVGTIEKVVGTVAVMAVILGGGSYWTGSWVEQEFREGAAKATKQGAMTVNVVDYQRGVFGASARTDVVFMVPFGEDSSGAMSITVPVIHSIRHGPLPALTAAARIHSEMQLTEEILTRFSELFGADPFESKAPLTIDTVIGWGGEKRLHLVSPKFEALIKEDQTKVSWGGLNSEIVMSAGLTHQKGTLEIGGLSFIKNDDDVFQIGRITLKLDAARSERFEFISTGTTSIDLNKLHFRGIADNGAVRGIEFENFRIKVDASIKEGALGSELKFDADKIIVEGRTKETIERPRLTFQLENIDAGAYEAILQAMQKTLGDQIEQEDEANQGQAMDTVLQEQIKVLLLRQPALSIKEMSAQWPEGVATGNFRIAYTGDGNPHPDSQPLSSLSGDLQLSVPRALVIRQMSARISEEVADALEDGEENEINVGKKTQEEVDKQMAAMLKNGLFAEKEDTLTVDARLRGSELNLNGKVQPLEILLGLLPL